MTLLDQLTAEARLAPDSGISTIIDYGRERPGIIPLWAGEGDMATPEFISNAAIEGLRNGETFYTWQRGIPELRTALADYHGRHFGRDFQPEEFMVTGSGMHAIQLALQATVHAGDEAVYLSPAWPNFPAAASIVGTKPVPVQLEFSDNGWMLDPEKLAAAIRIGKDEGMQQFNDSLKGFIDREFISRADAFEISPNVEELKMTLKGIDVKGAAIL